MLDVRLFHPTSVTVTRHRYQNGAPDIAVLRIAGADGNGLEIQMIDGMQGAAEAMRDAFNAFVESRAPIAAE